ncbi:cAMP and cAMP-inhibited cGMP 3',5'-cyclic phosphodiesterase 10A-like [Ptychodera flava]|uniref:cAMP and cAMP-inhibited cGMP 3',5'-cyclic phosphodiesterase 10A-like n=1 Tax=Ptychodera flava TaxID=63121 RepID=UPI00396A6D3C
MERLGVLVLFLYLTGISHLTPETVKAYLYSNSWIVGEYLHEVGGRDSGTDTDAEHDGRRSRNRSTSIHLSDRVEKSLSELSKDLEDQDRQAEVFYQLAQALKLASNADDVSLYIVDSRLDLYLCKADPEDIGLILSRPLKSGLTVAAYVGRTRKPLLAQDILGDERFPEGTGIVDSKAQSIVCVPILQANGTVNGVIELSRNYGSQPFTKETLDMVQTFLKWTGVAIEKVQVCKGLMKQRELNDFLLEVSRVIFDDIIAMDTLIEHIMTFAKNLVNADRCALFQIDDERKELYAEMFDEGNDQDGQPVFSKKKKIRFSVQKGLAGHVARTGEVLNIPNAYADPRFNREVDKRTGYTTQSLLCMPIVSRGVVIGVVQMVNKRDGPAFTFADECNFRMFAVYCAIALHYSKLYGAIKHSESLLKVALEKLSYHSISTDVEVAWLRNTARVKEPAGFHKFEFDYMTLSSNTLCQLFIMMIHQLFGEDSFEMSRLIKFTLTVRKNYRKVPYHNWWHAFNVIHSMFLILEADPNLFTELERQALIISCICHDVDHHGYTNQFMQKYETPLASLYSTSIMEQHHFNQTVTILQQDGHNIFDHLTSNAYKQVLGYIRHFILATDLALFLPNQRDVAKLCLDETLDLENTDHRGKVQSLLMTACDLCAVAKAWPVQMKTVECIYEEFYAQGDEEKKRGEQPIPMMDRDNEANRPQEQVNFISIFCIPLYTTLCDILPYTEPLLQNTKDNLQQWQRIVDGESTAMWQVDVSRVNKDKKQKKEKKK